MNHSQTTPDSVSKPKSMTCDICSFESVEYDTDEAEYRAIFDAEAIAPSTAVIGAVATIAETDPLDLTPLQKTIDTDALDTLFSPRPTADGDSQVTFVYDGYDVTLHSYGSVVVRSPSAHVTAHATGTDE